MPLAPAMSAADSDLRLDEDALDRLENARRSRNEVRRTDLALVVGSLLLTGLMIAGIALCAHWLRR